MDEFAHLLFVQGNSPAMAMVYNIATMGIADFIDFDTRVSHLYTSQFARFLDEFYQTFGGQNLFDSSLAHFSQPTIDIVSGISRYSTFLGVSSNLAPVLPELPVKL